jgi:hypothetical protein
LLNSKRPLTQAAASTDYFEHARVHCSSAQITLDDAQLREARGLRFQATGITSTVRNFTILDAVLDADTGSLFQDQLEIPETAYFEPAGAKRDFASQCGELVRLDDGEDFIMGYNNIYWNYQYC